MRNVGWLAFIIALLFSAAGIGFFFNSRLTEKHRSRDSMELVGLAISLLVTFTAIVLGLLTTSVKSGYDAAYAARGAFAGELAQLNRCLTDFGPETATARGELRSYVAGIIASTWPEEAPPTGVSYPDVSKMARTGENSVLANMLDDVGQSVRALQGQDERGRNQAAACRQQFQTVTQARWAVIEGLRRSISKPFFWVLMFWLFILFASFGLRAPPNQMSVIIIGLSIFSVAIAMFVILDMDTPYGGLFGIPSDAMRKALADMM